MLNDADFWSREKGAPLLRRNHHFLAQGEPLDADLRDRVDKWPALCAADDGGGAVAPPEHKKPDDAAERIFLRDAERTFADETDRAAMISLLRRTWPETADYHQGLGYVASVLLLLFDEETALRILLRLARDDKYTPGYWHAAPQAYVRDAMVYARLVAERFPEVSALLSAACVVPEAYASKWLIGLCVHVLPYAALFDYFEAFLDEGHLFLFKFSLALIARTSDKLLACKPTEVNIILEILRLDLSQFPEDAYGSEWFVSLVSDARGVALEAEQVAALREEEGVILSEKMARIAAREAQMALEASSDDEIVFSDETDED